MQQHHSKPPQGKNERPFDPEKDKLSPDDIKQFGKDWDPKRALTSETPFEKPAKDDAEIELSDDDLEEMTVN